ncbi:alpha/beta hydrolase [Lactobacillaceae bacterium Melli_B4]
MKIKDEMIDSELRLLAKKIRRWAPKMTPRRFKLINRITAFKRGQNHTNLQFEQRFITRDDGTKLRVCIYRPKQPKADAPGILWLHGGGYAIGLPELETRLFVDIVNQTGATLVAPDYRLSTDHPYPAALRDAYLSLKWLRSHTHEYQIRSDQLITAGPSAGGGLVAALSLYSRDQGEINIAFQMPLYPMLDNRLTPSKLNNDAPIWNAQYDQVAWQMNLKSFQDQRHVSQYAVPANATNFKHLPPTISMVGGVDPFLDETVNYIDHLKAAGVPTQFKVFPGAFHMFEVVAGNTDIAKQAHTFMLNSFKDYVAHYFAAQPN